ncbi:HEPN domain-containing protein [Candidatus Woesearchaeota archaeon]|nr:HEPN domain-containing protein [Candidatus Woesearchaeota archaeon]
MKKLEWCCKQKRGISLVEPNKNISDQYMKEANETLDQMLRTKGRWKVIMAYYACYNAFYSILIRAGIKSEIHDCTIALMKKMPEFKEDEKYISKLKSDRIDVQYYLKDIELDKEENIKTFILKCKSFLEDVNTERLREIITEMIKGDKN